MKKNVDESIFDETRKLISFNEIGSAISGLKAFYKNKNKILYHEVILIDSRYNDLNRKKNLNLITFESESIERSKIAESLINLIENKKTIKTKKISIVLLFCFTLILLAFFFKRYFFQETAKNELIDIIEQRNTDIQSSTKGLTALIDSINANNINSNLINNRLNFYKENINKASNEVDILSKNLSNSIKKDKLILAHETLGKIHQLPKKYKFDDLQLDSLVAKSNKQIELIIEYNKLFYKYCTMCEPCMVNAVFFRDSIAEDFFKIDSILIENNIHVDKSQLRKIGINGKSSQKVSRHRLHRMSLLPNSNKK